MTTSAAAAVTWRERRLPRRYDEEWRALFLDRAHAAIRESASVLDVGSGRRPAIPIDRRPPGVHYVGLDLSARELASAPEDSYDATVIGDITVYDAALAGRFDAIVSWQALEHVRPLLLAVRNCRSYLRPGGQGVFLVTGSRAVFALLNRVIPHDVAVYLMSVLLGRTADSVFRAEYDMCHYEGLKVAFDDWKSVEIIPRFRGASYFSFSPVLQHLYLRYENWIARSGRKNLATHYVIVARR